MRIIRSLAVAAAAGAMTLGVAGTTAASPAPAPSGPGVVQQAAGGNGPAAAAHTSGPTHILEHASKGYGNPVFMPSKFYLVGGRAANTTRHLRTGTTGTRSMLLLPVICTAPGMATTRSMWATSR